MSQSYETDIPDAQGERLTAQEKRDALEIASLVKAGIFDEATIELHRREGCLTITWSAESRKKCK